MSKFTQGGLVEGLDYERQGWKLLGKVAKVTTLDSKSKPGNKYGIVHVLHSDIRVEQLKCDLETAIRLEPLVDQVIAFDVRISPEIYNGKVQMNAWIVTEDK